MCLSLLSFVAFLFLTPFLNRHLLKGSRSFVYFTYSCIAFTILKWECGWERKYIYKKRGPFLFCSVRLHIIIKKSFLLHVFVATSSDYIPCRSAAQPDTSYSGPAATLNLTARVCVCVCSVCVDCGERKGGMELIYMCACNKGVEPDALARGSR